MQKYRHFIYFKAFISLACLLVLSACSNQKNSVKDTIVYCSEGDPEYFNPQLDTSVTTSDASAHQLYDRLIEFNPENGRLEAGLASSWLVSRDGLTYTFQLRRRVQFHMTDYFTPTRNFNANDVIFSFDRWRDPNHSYHMINGGSYPYFDSLGLQDTIKDIKRINGYRIEISLYKPDRSFLANLATDFAVILSKEYADLLMQEGRPRRLDTHPIGTGPFKFVSYRQNQYIRFVRNDQYFGEIAKTQQLVFDITQKSSLRLAKLFTSECDAMALPSQSDLNIIDKESDLILLEEPGLNVGFWAFNTQKPPFDNPQVRKALSLAIDKTSILDTIYLGQATRARTLVSSASWAYQTDAQELGYNPVKARELLREAGVPSDFSMDIWAIPVARAYNPNAMKMAQLIQRYLKDVGITLNIISYDWNLFRENLSNGVHDSVLIGWNADNGDPDNFYRPLLTCEAVPSGTNRAMWCNKNYDEIIQQALLTNDEEERKFLYHLANSIIFEEMPLVPIAHAYQYQAIRSNIVGMQINQYGGIKFDKVEKLH